MFKTLIDKAKEKGEIKKDKDMICSRIRKQECLSFITAAHLDIFSIPAAKFCVSCNRFSTGVSMKREKRHIVNKT